jgi:hypothetical protein
LPLGAYVTVIFSIDLKIEAYEAAILLLMCVGYITSPSSPLPPHSSVHTPLLPPHLSFSPIFHRYVGYVTIMYFNERLEVWVTQRIKSDESMAGFLHRKLRAVVESWVRRAACTFPIHTHVRRKRRVRRLTARAMCICVLVWTRAAVRAAAVLCHLCQHGDGTVVSTPSTMWPHHAPLVPTAPSHLSYPPLLHLPVLPTSLTLLPTSPTYLWQVMVILEMDQFNRRADELPCKCGVNLGASAMPPTTCTAPPGFDLAAFISPPSSRRLDLAMISPPSSLRLHLAALISR